MIDRAFAGPEVPFTCVKKKHALTIWLCTLPGSKQKKVKEKQIRYISSHGNECFLYKKYLGFNEYFISGEYL